MADYVSCSFCGKSSRDVVQMVAGPNGNICDGCVDRSARIIGRNVTAIGEASAKAGPAPTNGSVIGVAETIAGILIWPFSLR